MAHLVHAALFIAMLTPAMSIGQSRNDNWQFYREIGISFTAGYPQQTVGGQIKANFNTSVISTTSGGLLFYTNSDTIWNSQHQIMLNGTGIIGENNFNGPTIIPHPGFADLYYVFTTDLYHPTLYPDAKMGYCIVDMNEDGGLGAVVVKNVLLDTLISDKSAATLDESGTGYWALFHKIGSNEFIAYHLTPTGLTLPPVSSFAGSVYTPALGSGESQMQFSQDGQMILTSYVQEDLIQMFHFNRTTGIVSNAIELYSPITLGPNPLGLEISPSGQKIYFTTNNINHRSLFQADISVWDSTIIENSIQLIDSLTNNNAIDHWASLELAPDGRIYMGRSSINWCGVINAPDQIGVICDFDMNGFDLSPNIGSGGLPNQINRYHDDDVGILETPPNPGLQLYPNPTSKQLTLQLAPQWAGKKLELQWHDARGRLLKSELLNYAPQVELDLKDLETGMYLLSLYGDGELLGRESVVLH